VANARLAIALFRVPCYPVKTWVPGEVPRRETWAAPLAEEFFEGRAGGVGLEPAVLGFEGGCGDFGERPRGEGAEMGFEDRLERKGNDLLPTFLTALFEAFSDGRAEDLVFHYVDVHFGIDPPGDFLFQSYYASEEDEGTGGFLLLRSGEFVELREDDAHDGFRVRASEEGPFVVGPVVAFEEGRAVHFAEVADGVVVAGAGALVAGGHGERAAADVENGLFDGLAEGALQGDGVLQHAEGHLGVVVDLEFQLAVGPVGAVGEEVDAEIADLRQFDVGPVDDFAEEEAGKYPLGTAEERFEGWSYCCAIPLEEGCAGERETLSAHSRKAASRERTGWSAWSQRCRISEVARSSLASIQGGRTPKRAARMASRASAMISCWPCW
jgi:hypothetical protein